MLVAASLRGIWIKASVTSIDVSTVRVGSNVPPFPKKPQGKYSEQKKVVGIWIVRWTIKSMFHADTLNSESVKSKIVN